jgi:hypothetical protein
MKKENFCGSVVKIFLCGLCILSGIDSFQSYGLRKRLKKILWGLLLPGLTDEIPLAI